MQKIACKFWNSAAWAEAGGICFGITWLWLEKLAFFFLLFFFKGKQTLKQTQNCHKKQRSDPASNLVAERGCLDLSLPSFGRFDKMDTASQVHHCVKHFQQTFTFSNARGKLAR